MSLGVFAGRTAGLLFVIVCLSICFGDIVVSQFALSECLLLASSGGDANPLAAPVDLALWTLVVFLGLMFVLGKYAWKPIIEGLNAREKGIADNIESAARAQEEAQSSLAAYQAKMAGAHDEAAALIAEARNDAAATKEKLMAEANEEANRTRQKGLADVEAAKSAAVRELAESSVDSAVSLASNIVGRSLKKEDHAKLIEESVKRFAGS